MKAINIDIKTSEDFSFALKELEKQLNFKSNKNGTSIKAIKVLDKHITVSCSINNNKFTYYDKSSFFRAFSLALQYIGQEKEIKNTPAIKDLGMMLNCSRGVLRVETVKLIIREAALMGYNYIKLYTEETYEIPEEPYFGYLRGRYTQSELKEIVEYGEHFGVEMVPCIQTLAHIVQIFKWEPYKRLRDIGDTLLVEDDRTYELIENMIKSLRQSYKTKRINIGMDEGYFMGLGRYNWFKGPSSDRSMLFINHLKKVVEICKKYDFEVEAWFDMLFGINFKGYIDPSEEMFTGFSDEVKKAFPKIKLVYWNYQAKEVEKFSRIVGYLKQLSDNVSFAGFSYGHGSFGPGNKFSHVLNTNAKKCCLVNNISDYLVTSWGDSVGVTAQIPSFYCIAEDVYEGEGVDFNERCKFLFGYNFEEFCKLDLINLYTEDQRPTYTPSYYMFANDVMLGIMDGNIPFDIDKKITDNSKILYEMSKVDSMFSNTFVFGYKVLEALAPKSTLGLLLRKAYKAEDKAELKLIAEKLIPETIDKIQIFLDEFWKYWMYNYKSYGWEKMDLRISGVIGRLKTAKKEILMYLSGELKSLEMLETEILPYNTKLAGKISNSPVWDNCTTNLVYNLDI